jgi:hypothetical protein
MFLHKTLPKIVEHQKLTAIAGNTAIKARNKEPGKVINDIILSKKSPVSTPGLNTWNKTTTSF